MLYDTLPPALRRLLTTHSWQADTAGESSAQTFRLSGSENYYLKISPVDIWGGLQTEAHSLTWLATYLPAPEVVFYERINETDYLLIREVPGLPASDLHWQSNPERLVETLATALKMLHSLAPATCPFDQRTTTKLQEVGRYVANGLVDADDFEPENEGKTPRQILDQLHAEQPAQDDLVVTHGDFCLPNVLLANWQLSGFIDTGQVGVGDRYQDLALCSRSLEHTFGTDQYNALLFGTYGLPAIDPAKLRYFRLLDELK